MLLCPSSVGNPRPVTDPCRGIIGASSAGEACAHSCREGGSTFLTLCIYPHGIKHKLSFRLMFFPQTFIKMPADVILSYWMPAILMHDVMLTLKRKQNTRKQRLHVEIFFFRSYIKVHYDVKHVVLTILAGLRGEVGNDPHRTYYKVSVIYPGSWAMSVMQWMTVG